MKRLVIVGNSANSRLARWYFEKDTNFSVVAYAVNRSFLTGREFDGLPVVELENIENIYPPKDYAVFIGIGYKNMNKDRANLFSEMKGKGYSMPNYVSPRCCFLTTEPIGENNFILEDNTIQPFVKIGSNNVIWSGNHIGHESEIGNNNFITSHVVVSGFVKIKNNCFLGVNSTLRDGIVVENETLIAAGSVIMKDTVFQGVYMPARTVMLDRKSSEIKIS